MFLILDDRAASIEVCVLAVNDNGKGRTLRGRISCNSEQRHEIENGGYWLDEAADMILDHANESIEKESDLWQYRSASSQRVESTTTRRRRRTASK